MHAARFLGGLTITVVVCYSTVPVIYVHYTTEKRYHKLLIAGSESL